MRRPSWLAWGFARRADIQTLLIEHDCRQLLLRAAAAADASDAPALAALFSPDATLVRPGRPPIHGRSAIQASYAQRPAERLTRHLLTNILVEVTGPDRARATSAVLLWSGHRDDPPGPHGRPADAQQVLGQFDDLLLRTPEGWRIHERHASFIFCTGADA